MEEAIRSAVAQAVERFAAHTGTVRPSASPVPSSSPTSCDISRIHVKARWLIRMLARVRATLDDAEDMNMTDESVRDWLRELQEVADAAEDLLDEFPHEALRLGFVGDGGWTAGNVTELPRQRKSLPRMTMIRGQVRHSSPATPPHEHSAFLSCVEQRMEDIVSRFMKIKKPEQALQLDYGKEQMDAESISARRTASSVLEETRIVGRIEELAKIKQFLLSSDAEESRGSDDTDDHVSVMAIVGMGGLGKTTLAQLTYSDAQVNQHFRLKSWVYVSEDFDVIQLTKSMLLSLNVDDCGLSELDPLHQKLVHKLSGEERFLLVLDDVWEAENLNIHYWDQLTAPFRNRSANTKIIVTTRSRKVSEMVPRTSTYDLGFLSDRDTLKLFMLHAFEGRDPNLYQNLVAIGKKTAKKCQGVPLAAKTLGGLLCTKDDEEWNKILDTEDWNATINQEDSIIPILRLSYQHLPAPVKRCFKYCSLFPKGYVFDRNQIIRMWMAQGYIKANRRELMEDIGQRYIDNLLSRSFFQKYPKNPEGLQMHDLLHDLARCVSGDECYSMEGNKPCLIPPHVRHLSAHRRRSITLPVEEIAEPKSFRSFLLHGENLNLSKYTFQIFKRSRYLTSGHEQNIFLNLSKYTFQIFKRLLYLTPSRALASFSSTRMEHLRVLDLSGVPLDRFPTYIACLKHVRFLRISVSGKALPESLGSMYHLQTLDLGRLSKLPNSISNLHNLRHLILSSRDCVRYPVGIGMLKDLQTMPGFHVSQKHNHAKLGELKDMNSIRGEFAIKGLENLADVNEAKKACLDKKRNISSLNLEWDLMAASSPIDDEVLESLKPSAKLRSLKISSFKGPSYPSWLGDGSFSRLGTIKLEHCKNLISLPPLGQLPSLKSLCISKARAVEYIAGEFFSGGFPQLEELTFEYLYKWKSWCGAQIRDCRKLKKLCIKQCGSLESFSLINLGAVEDISISNCPKLRFMPGHSLELSHLPCVQTIKIQDTYQVGLIDAAHLSLAAPSEDDPHLQLEDVGRREAEYILGMWSKNICRLTVKRCWDLTSLPLGNQSALKYVKISDCPQFRITSVSPQLWQLPSLQGIHVNGVHEAESITVLFGKSQLELENVDQFVASYFLKEFSHMIRRLVVTRCENLTSLPLMELTVLEYLRIRDCPLFQLLDAEQLPPTLQVLSIYGNSYEREQCSRHQHFQRLKQVQQSSNKEGGCRNLYLVFQNVHDTMMASEFCSLQDTNMNALEIEWHCCSNVRSNVKDLDEEILRLLSASKSDFWSSLKKLVIRGYTGSWFACSLWHPDLLSLSSVSLLQCSKCEILPPLGQLHSLKELFVEGASSLESFMQDRDDMSEDIAFPRLQKLEFHNMPVWKEWLGTREGDFPRLRKLILKHCPKLRALPHLPPSLEELELEACDELTSLSASDSPIRTKSLGSSKPFRWLSLSTSKGTSCILQHMSLTNCPLLLAWCEGQPRILADIPSLLIDGVRVHTNDGISIRSQIRRIRMNGRVPRA